MKDKEMELNEKCRGVLGVVLLLTLGRAAMAGPPDLASLLSTRLEEMQCPGAVVGVFPDEGEPLRFALGVADVETKTPMTIDMHMRVGSLLKPMLGTLVLKLVDEGKLSLDDPVSKYVDGVPNGERITLRMLGENRSGVFNTIENKAFQKAVMERPAHDWTPKEIFDHTFNQPTSIAPGERWRYSNTNAVLLALCVEVVTGRPWGNELQKRVCQPLGMMHTAVPDGPTLPDPHPSAYRNGYPDKVIGYGDVFYDVSNYSAGWTHAAGNLYSTLDDLGLAAKPLFTGELLSEASRDAFLNFTPTGNDGVDYGFCLYRRGEGIGHTGDVPGFNSLAAYYPQRRLSVVVLTNLSNNADGTMPADELSKVILANLPPPKD
jgi:D-alanyl-D-alanine carboxypeptidase